MQPKEPVTVKTNEVAVYKVKFRNVGLDTWPSTTSLYQIDYSKFSAFNDDKISIKANECKSQGYKFIEVPICAPSEPGTYTYSFQMGTDLETLFGQEITITLIVE